MVYFNILKSKRENKCYIGSTRDFKLRIRLHITRKVHSTKKRTPLSLVCYEIYASEKDARDKEQTLKDYGHGITNIYKRIENSQKLYEKGAG